MSIAHFLSLLGLALLALLWNPGEAVALWIPDGIPVCTNPSGQDTPSAASDGAGGAIVIWRDTRDFSMTDHDLYAQRVTADGRLAPAWPADGAPVCTAPGLQGGIFAIPDGVGGAYVSWTDRRNVLVTQADVYLTRITASGTVSPGWPLNGRAISAAPRDQIGPWLAPDEADGVFVAWSHYLGTDQVAGPNDLRVLRFTADGSVVPGWPDTGIVICEGFGSTRTMGQIAPDGSGGLIVVWVDSRNNAMNGPDVFALRVTSQGEIAPGWLPNGTPVVTAAETQTWSTLAPDGTGGAILAWADDRHRQPDDFPGDQTDIYAQHLLGDGTIAPGWPVDGVPLAVAPRAQLYPDIVTDTAGGAIVVWYDDRDYWVSASDLYGQRVRGDGTIAPGWPVNGLALARTPGFELFPIGLVSDGMGGALVAYVTLFSERDLNVQYVTANGAFAPGWPPEGRPLCHAPRLQDSPTAVTDGAGGMIVAWEDTRAGRQDRDIYAQRVTGDGPVPVLLSLASAEPEPGRVVLRWHGLGAAELSAFVERRTMESAWETLGLAVADGPDLLRCEDRSIVPGTRYAYRLAYRDETGEQFTAETWVEIPALALSLAGFRPNPAIGTATVAFSLPDERPARLDVIDVRGRVVHSREVGSLGGGSHVLPLVGETPLGPGMYWIRLSHPERTLTTKGLVVR